MIKGMKEIEANLKKLAKQVERNMADAVGVAAFEVQRGAQMAIRTPSQGETVTRYRQGQKPFKHMVSRAGDAPNTDTGRLIGSIFVDHTRGDTTALVGSPLDYAFFLETVHNRPFLIPAFNEVTKHFSADLRAATNRAIEKVTK